MNTKLKAVQKFHEAFGLGIQFKPTANLPYNKLKLQFDLIARIPRRLRRVLRKDM